MARVLVEVPDVAIVTVWKSISDDPLVLPAVTATFRHNSGYQSWRANIDLQPLIHCKQKHDKTGRQTIKHVKHEQRMKTAKHEGYKN